MLENDNAVQNKQTVSCETKESEISCPRSETSKFRHLTAPYCKGIGVDIGAAGDPVVPSAICVDLPQPYCPPFGPAPVHMPINAARHLTAYFQLECLDYVYSSHLLEDFPDNDWPFVLRSWGYLVRPGGYLVLLVPDRDLWRRALAKGQPPNEAHRHEFSIGELANAVAGPPERRAFPPGWKVIREEIPDPNDYSILFVARREE